MRWARVVRGMASVAKAVTLRAASARTAAEMPERHERAEVDRAGAQPADLVSAVPGRRADLEHDVGRAEQRRRGRARSRRRPRGRPRRDSPAAAGAGLDRRSRSPPAPASCRIRAPARPAARRGGFLGTPMRIGTPQRGGTVWSNVRWNGMGQGGRLSDYARLAQSGDGLLELGVRRHAQIGPQQVFVPPRRDERPRAIAGGRQARHQAKRGPRVEGIDLGRPPPPLRGQAMVPPPADCPASDVKRAHGAAGQASALGFGPALELRRILEEESIQKRPP